MTVSQALVLSLLIALWASSSGVNLANNTVILITLLIALMAFAYATDDQNNFYNRCCGCPGLSGNNSLIGTSALNNFGF